MSKKRSNKEQIEFLKEVKLRILLDYPNTNIKLKGLCSYMLFTNPNWGPVNVPLFTKENAIKHANAIDEPDNSYWWEYHHDDIEQYNLDNRLLFIDWMISELSKKQPNMWQRFIAFMNKRVPIEDIVFPG